MEKVVISNDPVKFNIYRDPIASAGHSSSRAKKSLKQDELSKKNRAALGETWIQEKYKTILR